MKCSDEVLEEARDPPRAQRVVYVCRVSDPETVVVAGALVLDGKRSNGGRCTASLAFTPSGIAPTMR